MAQYMLLLHQNPGTNAALPPESFKEIVQRYYAWAEELRQKATRMEREAEEAAALREARLKLMPNDPVQVPRFDKPGRIVRVDHKRNLAVVSLGIGQWEVSLEDVFPLDK